MLYHQDSSQLIKTSLSKKKLSSLLLFLALSVIGNNSAQDSYAFIEEFENPSVCWGPGLMINEAGIAGAFETPIVPKLCFKLLYTPFYNR